MTVAVLLSTDKAFLAELKAAFQRHAPQIAVTLAQEEGAVQAGIAVCWHPPAGSLARLPNIRLVHSVAAGVDHLASDPSCAGLPICRVVDAGLCRGMVEYVRWAVIHYHRGFDAVLRQQVRTQWLCPAQIPATSLRVGVMGLGAIGKVVAADLAGAGYTVSGWARTPKDLPGIQAFFGNDALPDFLNGLNFLINLLPLTEQTQGILGAETFGYLAAGAILVNAGRGEHLVVEDLLWAIQSGRIKAALLDVFLDEPLPDNDVLWRSPGIIVTPHMASSASLQCIVGQVVENISRLSAGRELVNQVDPKRGY